MATPFRLPRKWQRDELIQYIVAEVVSTGKTPSVVVDTLGPVEFADPKEQWEVLRVGLVFLANDYHGMRGLRSGRSGYAQSVRGPRGVVPESGVGLDNYVRRRLLDLVFSFTADGSEKSVLMFTHDDAKVAFDYQVRRPIAGAKRQEPFWKALINVTAKGRTLAQCGAAEQKRFYDLAIKAGLTVEETAA